MKRRANTKHRNLLLKATENIICLEANVNYTYFILSSGKKEVMSFTIAMHDEMLD